MATLPSKPPETGKHMTKIWKETGFVDGDIWVTETEERTAGEGEKALLPLEAFLEAVAETNDVGLGVFIAPADDVKKLEPHLDRIALIAVASLFYWYVEGWSLLDAVYFSAITIATGGIKYIATDARLTSTCFNT